VEFDIDEFMKNCREKSKFSPNSAEISDALHENAVPGDIKGHISALYE
jgi:hypothetical protein